jgi:Mg-chelatase subunit ChlD
LELVGTGGQAVAADRPARREWWRPLAWIGLALLVAEWLVQYRGALARLWAGTQVQTGLLLLLSSVIPSDRRESRNLHLQWQTQLQWEIPRFAALARNDGPHISFSNPSALWALLIFLPLLALPFVGRRDRPTLRRWLGVALRLLIGSGLILGLAGAQLVRPVDDLTVVFLLDLSDSVPAAEQERAKAFIRQAVAGMPGGDRAAIVAFGEDALVERLASEERDLPPIASAPRPGRTDVAAAIRLGLALFPEESQKRLVLLSDGLENVGEALAQADLTVARGVEIAVAPLLAPPAEQEAYLAELEMPATVRQSQAFAATAVIESTLAQEATLYLLGDGRLLTSKTVSLQPGTNRVQLSLTATDTGFHRYRAELVPALDTLPQNNLASGFVVVYGPPRVLIVAGEAGEVDALRRALASTGAEVDVVAPAMLPSELAILSGYDAVVLAGMPAEELPDDAMEALPVYVRELGRGLVMLGGEQGYGAGGYLRTPLEAALPVDMDVRSRTKEPNVALVLAVDKSGSMGRCHCDDPDALPGEYERVETGLPKVDIAKDAIVKASNVLGPLDYLGVVAFDENALWALQLQQLVAAAVLQNAVGAIQAEGQTNIWAGLTQAEEALLETEARVKHIILLTDGWSRSGDYAELTARLAEEGITLSIVAAGSGSAEYLRGLAEAGGGRYYPAPTIRDLPQIFLKETIKAVGSYIIEEPFYPLPSGATPILRGLDPMTLPALMGYNGTTPKATAQVALVSPRGDPLLAQWQYGLGRSVAWTSDLKGRWATDWLAWERFNTFAAQLVGWTLPEPADERVQVSLKLDGAEVRVQVDSTDESNRPRDLLETEATLIGPELSQQTVELEQTAAGRYEGSAFMGDPGAYLVQIVQRDEEGQPVARQMAGLVVPYSPEYKRSGQGGTLLNELARATGGSTLDTPDAAFAPTQQPASRARPLWPSLFLLAALIFPLDVAVRRLQLTPSDWRRLATWARERLPRRRIERRISEPVLLGDLFQARERARRRGARPIESSEIASSVPDPSPEPPSVEPTAPSLDDDTLGRLRQARDRARRRR